MISNIYANINLSRKSKSYQMIRSNLSFDNKMLFHRFFVLL